ncbi:glycosyltransferase [Cylindrospermopsis curvispora]|uniref:Glycosyltransferase family 2 protein n=1 Tax=Cylindrospermopsis curvispora GIHE-G1 TaxID=2666332 RepID=A0A7H0F1N2_9CYAN|nr:glycosyltransferase [Cylindrospermopsis curvispora]QNP29948.1 glycosyltransferase family 2 protein [Cylindrospermopsis curvispora GIHE-G1]
MDVSIIITNYQQGKLLLPLLDYLWKSNWFPYQVEMIVVDNLSSESESLRQTLYLKEQQVSSSITTRFIFLDQNYGPSYSRNRGVEKAQGEYIQLLDADDWFNPVKIIRQYNFALENNFPSFITSNWARVTWESDWNHRKDICIYQPHFSNPIPLSLIKDDGFVPLMSGLINRQSFLEAGGFREDQWLIEDVRFLIDLSKINSNFIVFPSKEPLFFYRVGNSQSLSSSRKLEFCNACYENAVYVQNLIDASQLGENELNIFLQIYGQLARFFFEHDHNKFHEVLTRIRRIDQEYIPTSPQGLRQLSKWLGYEQAEAIALIYRKVKRIIS